MTTNKNSGFLVSQHYPNHSLFTNIKKDKIPGTIKPLRGSILFLPSRYEGFSLSLVEGMSQGLVPICYPVGVAPEIIRNGVNGFIVHSQQEAIQKVRLLCSDKALRSRCTRGAEKTARIFSSDVIAEKLLAVYRTVLTKHSTQKDAL